MRERGRWNFHGAQMSPWLCLCLRLSLSLCVCLSLCVSASNSRARFVACCETGRVNGQSRSSLSCIVSGEGPQMGTNAPTRHALNYWVRRRQRTDLAVPPAGRLMRVWLCVLPATLLRGQQSFVLGEGSEQADTRARGTAGKLTPSAMQMPCPKKSLACRKRNLEKRIGLLQWRVNLVRFLRPGSEICAALLQHCFLCRTQSGRIFANL